MMPDRGVGRRPALSRAAKAWLVALGVMLALPSAAARLQGEGALESFHNRTLARWPVAEQFGRDPAGYFAQANRWLADRVYPIVSATVLKNNLAYFALHASPAANVTVAGGGLVFLNGTEADAENDLVTGACASAADPTTLSRLEGALQRIAGFGRRSGLAIDVVMVPTVPLLYGDRLPRSFPPTLRKACAAGPAGRAPLGRVSAPEGLRFVYPFRELSALRDDPAMFPLGDFHPDGLSVKLVTDAYLRAIGAPALALSVTRGSAPSEVLADHGVVAQFPVYAVAGSSVAMDGTDMATLLATVKPFYDDPGEAVYVYRDRNAPNPDTVLMLSDSYGYNQGISFAAAFRTVVQMPAPDRTPAALLAAVAAIMPVDRLVLVFNDSNFGRVIDFGDALPPPAGG